MTTESLSQNEIEYGKGWACYKMDEKEQTPIVSWAFIQGFCAALADHGCHEYQSVKAAFEDFFGARFAKELVAVAAVELERPQEWFRWPSIKLS